MRALIALGIVCLATAGTAYAGTPRINHREHAQQQRINEGVRSGELTRREAGRLEAQQAAIRAQEAYYRRTGGHVSASERRTLNRELNSTNRRIARQKHDGQDRY